MQRGVCHALRQIVAQILVADGFARRQLAIAKQQKIELQLKSISGDKVSGDITKLQEENGGSVLLPLFLPFTVLAIPLLDFVMAILRRVKAGRSPFTADREHLHHRIMRFGLSQQRTTVVLYLWSAMFAFPTVIAAFVPFWIAIIAGIFIFALSIWVIRSNKVKVEFK